MLILNGVQALFTPLHGDETYYWLFSKNLSWGYFDHPPMVALWIWFSQIFPEGNHLEIRGVTAVVSALLPVLYWYVLPLGLRQNKKHALTWVMLWVSTPVLHIYGFITTPDVPLLLGIVLYTVAFEKFYESNRWSHGLLWAATAAFLIYAKYHGGLYILLSALMRPAIFRRYKTYFSIAAGLLFITPHLSWQYRHQWVTINYQLVERAGMGFSWNNIGDFYIGALLILNPALIYGFVKTLSAYRTWPETIRYQARMVAAVFIFFALYVLRGRVEAHWVVMVSIPLLMVLQYAMQRSSGISQKWLFRVAGISVAIILILRGTMFTPLANKVLHTVPDEKEFYNTVKCLAGGRAVVFENSYSDAAKFQFYTRKQSYCRSDAYYHPTQFNFWNQKSLLHFKPVLLVGNYPHPAYDTLTFHDNKLIRGVYVDSFPILTSISGTLEALPKNLKTNQKVAVKGTLYNQDDNAWPWHSRLHTYQLKLQLRQGTDRHFFNLPFPYNTFPGGKKLPFSGTFTIPQKIGSGTYRVNLQIQANNLPPIKISGTQTVRFGE